MTKYFLHYWKPETATYELDQQRDPISIGSEQLTPRKVGHDDVIWIVSVEEGILILLGRIIVDAVKDRDAAIAELGTDDIWDTAYTVIARPGTVEPLRPIDITPIAHELTFQSTTAPRLKLIDGRVNPQQLQSTRLLTDESVDLLETYWNHADEENNKEAQ